MEKAMLDYGIGKAEIMVAGNGRIGARQSWMGRRQRTYLIGILEDTATRHPVYVWGTNDWRCSVYYKLTTADKRARYVYDPGMGWIKTAPIAPVEGGERAMPDSARPVQ